MEIGQNLFQLTFRLAKVLREKVRSIVGERRALREDDLSDLAFGVPFGDGVRQQPCDRNFRLRRFHVDVRQQIFLS